MDLLETGRGGPMFRWLGQALAIDLANTILVVKAGDIRDLLETTEQLGLWLEHERERLGECGFALTHLAELRRLRDLIHRLMTATTTDRRLPRDDVEQLNAYSAAAPPYPQIEITANNAPRHVERTAGDDPLDELRGRLARSAIELLGGPKRARLRICQAPNCGMFFLANPAKHDQRWCCLACGNRARVAAYYKRHARPGGGDARRKGTGRAKRGR